MLESPLPSSLFIAQAKVPVEEESLPKCYLDLAAEHELGCKVVVQLFADKLPITCENFINLVKGGQKDQMGRKMEYKNSVLYEMIPGWMVPDGDFVNNNGTEGESTFEQKEFEDETFAIDYNQPGLLCMLSHGLNTNSSLFFVTLKPADWLKGLYVSFGKVVYGLDSLERLAERAIVGNGKQFSKVLTVCDETTWSLVNVTADKCVDSVVSDNECSNKEFHSNIELVRRLPSGLNYLFGLSSNSSMTSSSSSMSFVDNVFLQDCSVEDLQLVTDLPQGLSKRNPSRPRVWKKNWETRSRINKLFDSVTLRKLKVGVRWYTRCSLCDQPVADDRWNLKAHASYHLRSKNVLDGLFICLICDRRGFLHRRECFKHVLNNHGIICPVESVHFNNKTIDYEPTVYSETQLCFPDASNVR